MVAAGHDLDYTDTLKKTFGRRGFYLGMSIFVIVLFVPIILYF